MLNVPYKPLERGDSSPLWISVIYNETTMLKGPRILESVFLFALALFSCTLFLCNDPWDYRDGVFLQHFVTALPFFLLTPTLIGISLYAGWKSVGICLVNTLLLTFFIAMPLTRQFAFRLIELAPLLWRGSSA
jgi:hypothetical protein